MNEDKQKEIGNRLKAARKDAGFTSATDAVNALGLNYQTYAAHENGNRGIGRDALELYSKRFKVSLDWLLTGKNQHKYTVPLMGYIGAGAEIMPEFEQMSPDGIDIIEVPFPMPSDMIAFQVKGDSMLPVYKDGYVIIVYKEQRKSIDVFYGEEAAVRTTDGRRFIKTIMRGAEGVNLMSWNAAPIENVTLEWIGEIFAVLPRQALRHVEKQCGIQGRLKM